MRCAMSVRCVNAFWVVGVHGLRLIIQDALANLLCRFGCQHLCLKNVNVLDKSRVTKLNACAVPKAHSLGEPVNGQVVVGKPVVGIVLLHGLEDAEADGTTGGRADAKDVEAAVRDVDSRAGIDFVVSEVVDSEASVRPLDSSDHGLG